MDKDNADDADGEHGFMGITQMGLRMHDGIPQMTPLDRRWIRITQMAQMEVLGLVAYGSRDWLFKEVAFLNLMNSRAPLLCGVLLSGSNP